MKNIEKTLDNLWQKAVKKRDNGRCRICYDIATDAHHLVSRRNKSTRWDINNGIAVCRLCHRLIHDKRVLLAIPDSVGRLSRQVGKFNSDDREMIKAGLKDLCPKVGEER